MKLRSSARVGACCLALLGSWEARAAVVDPAFVETPFVTGPNLITALAWAPDASSRLFVLRKTGLVSIVENGQLLTTPFALVTPITTSSECGLLGLAFDPDFVSNGYLYLFVTVSATEQQIIRYTAVGNTGTDKTVIVAGLPTAGATHDGGALGFGPDGKLYWAVGDNGNRSGVGADLTSLAAKVGRANRDGSAPADNPFVDGDGPNNDYIWARGFRNPFTLTFRPESGQLWLNVVGRRVEQVFALQAGDHTGWTAYESNQPAGFLSPIISYYTNLAPEFVIPAAGAVRTAGVSTISTTLAHRLRPGAKVTIAGVTNTSFNGTVFLQEVQEQSLSFRQSGADATSGGGTATPELIGGAITGGEFWDSSSVPPAYRGNFLFGDYNSGALMRARLDGASVTSVERFATGSSLLDLAVGPDGDLYSAAYAGAITRYSYLHNEQSLVVSRLHVRMAEGGKAAFGVRLAQQPNADVSVGVIRSSGDQDVRLLEGDDLTFTTADWAQPQRVMLEAGLDGDTDEDVAELTISSSGLASEVVKVSVTDDGLSAAGGAGGAGGMANSGGEGGAVSLGRAGDGGAASLGGAATGDGGVTSEGGHDGASSSAGEPSDVAGQSSTPDQGDHEGGCSCRIPSSAPHAPFGAVWLIAAGVLLRLRRRATRPRQRPQSPYPRHARETSTG